MTKDTGLHVAHRKSDEVHQIMAKLPTVAECKRAIYLLDKEGRRDLAIDALMKVIAIQDGL